MKSNVKTLLAIVLSLSLALALSACAEHAMPDVQNTGVPITPDAIDSMYAQFVDSQEAQSEYENELMHGLDGDTTVYWYGTQPKYHTSTECIHLRTAAEYESGALLTAIESGRTELCPECAAIDGLD